MSVHAATSEDIPALGEIAEAAGLFPAEAVADMIAPALAGGPDVWLVSGAEGGATGLAFARPEEMTDRVWNILAIGVLPRAQGQGIAGDLLTAMEASLDARMIVIETTQLPDQATARAFYERRGYREEGRVRDFFAAGEDKVIFRKVME